MMASTQQPDRLAAWLDSLPSFGPEPTKSKDEEPALPVDADPRHTSKVEKRRMAEIVMGDSAVAKLGALPVPGEALHVRMDGSFNGFDLIPALLKLLEPHTIAGLWIASLSFNRRVGERLCDLIDAGKVGRCTYLSSSMFEGKERHLVDWLGRELAARGSVLRVARNHTKLILAQTTDGRSIVCEGSFNQRTCSCFEQATFFDDASLLEWHRRFIDEVTR